MSAPFAKMKARAKAAWRLATGQRLVELLTQPSAGAPPLGLAGPLGLTGSTVSAAAPIGVGLSAEPPGWLGAIVAHGGACMTAEMEYMVGSKYGDRFHILPNMHAEWLGTGDQEVHLRFDLSSLLTNRYREWPCPVYPRTGATFLLPNSTGPYDHNGGSGDRWRQACHVDNSIGEVSALIEWGLDSEKHLSLVYGLSIDSSGHLLVGGEKVYPGARVAAWCNYTFANSVVPGKDEYQIANGRQLHLSALKAAQLGGSTARSVVVPAGYWRSHLAEYFDRLLRWYYTARWIVWAGEMFRLHSAGAEGTDIGAWKGHCLAWGIGVMDPDNLPARSPQWELYHHFEPGLWIGANSQFQKVLAAIMKHTPVPGSEGCTGQQIAIPGHARALCDIPVSAGSIRPPIEILDETGGQMWATLAVARFKQNEDFMPWFAVYRAILGIAIAIVGSYMGGAVSLATKAMTASLGVLGSKLVYLATTYMIQAVNKLGRGESLELGFSDVVGITGQILESSGLPATALKSIPDDLWAALKTAGAVIPPIAGTDWAAAQPYFTAIQDAIHTTTSPTGDYWPYADAAYAGLGLSQGVKDKVPGDLDL